nr:ABC transporter ATP-binding protein [Parablautia muri]
MQGINFEIKKGEAVALIGKNGCGKSTILKMLSHILKPDLGEIKVQGRVSSIIELGTGFHPDMTGRENAYMNASIYGIKEKEMKSKMDEIIQFAELEEYIDNPVRTYSSGMYMRLAFSVAINVDADILLIDEILAVGDASFQIKCFGKLQELKRKGTTIVLVTHSLGQIEGLCERAIWISGGRIREDGAAKQVCEHYLDEMNHVRQKRKVYENQVVRTQKIENEGQKGIQRTCLELMDEFNTDASREGNFAVYFTKAEVRNEDGHVAKMFATGDTIIVHLEYSCQERMAGNKIVFRVNLLRSDYIICYSVDSIEIGKDIYAQESGEIDLVMKDIHLLDAYYLLCIEITDEMGILYDKVSAVKKIGIRNRERTEVGIVHIEHDWNTKT